jgi:methane monooxygenase component A beta chain/propane monooxygenase small subunit
MAGHAAAGAAVPEAFDGFRTFVWFTPEKRRPTEYELYTVGQQSSPEHWLDVGWPVHYDNGAPPWSDESSAVRTTTWPDYRDPNRTWQRPYVATSNQDEQALTRLLPVLVESTAGTISPTWAKEVLGRTYAAWPFVEYGLFRALAYAVREARSDTIEFGTVFQAVDRMRLLQDIVLHLDLLQDVLPGFNDGEARAAWLTDPALVGVREVVENLVASTDWVEILVVTALVFEPIIGRLAKVELFSHRAPSFGDGATTAVLAQSVNDAARAAAAAQALVKLVIADAEHGAQNAALINGWISSWRERCTGAARALLGAFTDCGVDNQGASQALARVQAFHDTLIAECGLPA